MKEDLLHYIWKFKKYPIASIRTTKGLTVSVQSSGTHNHLSGPDFFNARLVLDEQLWAGNVEIHIKSSDWYAHKHETDSNYDNVVLHVVWDDDVAVFRSDGSEIPTLELKNYINAVVLSDYKKLFKRRPDTFINCGKDITAISDFSLNNWKERLYYERLERKSNVVFELLEDSNNDWEKVLFVLLLKNFGSKINGDFFFDLGMAMDFSIIRKLHNKPLELEALLFGLSGLLEDEEQPNTYKKELRQTYDYLCRKYELDTTILAKPQFFKLRPSNFPTIRLSQFARLYASEHSLFDKAIKIKETDFYTMFMVKTSTFWETHFTFDKTSKKGIKTTTKKFIDLLIINTILPLRFCYQRKQGILLEDTFSKPLLDIASEENSVLQKYRALGIKATSAKDSQALLELYANYCSKNKCLQCAVGVQLLTIKA